MVHSGAIIGAVIPQFKSVYFKWLKFPYFKSDRYGVENSQIGDQ